MTTAHPDIDTAELRAYLSEQLDEPVLDTDVLADGLNLVVGIATEGNDDAYVLRRPTKLRHTGYMNGLRDEYRILERLDATAIPAPEPVLFCDDESLVGGPFCVTTHVDGAEVPWGDSLPERFQNPDSRREVAHDLVDALADIHATDSAPFEGVCTRRTALEQVERAVDRLDAVERATGDRFPTLRSVADRLRERAPEHAETSLLHGDFKPDNVFLAGTDGPELAGVLDWEAAMLGDPRTELGYFLLFWCEDDDPALPLADLDARYPDAADELAHLRERDERGFWPFTARPGSPDRRELVARYEDRTGVAFERDEFYRAHGAVLLGTVWADLHRHEVEAGRESDWEPYVAYAALLADSIADGAIPL